MKSLQRCLILLFALVSSSCSTSIALSVDKRPAQPIDFYSANHKYVMHMEPQKGARVFGDGRGPGTATTRETGEGKKEDLWSLPFYARNVLLTNDGQGLIVVGAGLIRTSDVAITQKMGLINKSGQIVVKPEHEAIAPFRDGLAWYMDRGKFSIMDPFEIGFIDKTGNVALKPQFDQIHPFFEKRALVMVRKNKDEPSDTKGGPVVFGQTCGFIDETGAVVIKPQFDSAEDFSEGLASVEVGGKWGAIDKAGTMVIEPQYKYALKFHDGLALAQRYDDKSLKDSSGYIDKTGKQVIEPQMGGVGDFSEGLARTFVQEKTGFINKEGKTVVAPRFDNANDFSDGMAAVCETNKWGYIDKTGKVVIQPQYTAATPFSDGLASVSSGGKYSVIDKSGKEILKPQYEQPVVFSEGLAAVADNNKPAFIDKTGAVVLRLDFDGAGNFQGGFAPVAVFESKFMAESAIDFYRDGKQVKAYTVKDLIPQASPTMVKHSLGGGWMPWRAGEATLSSDEKSVSLSLLDGTIAIFDTSTGALLRKVPSPSPEKSQ